AGTGARMALLNKSYRQEIEKKVREIEKIETALEADFQAHFVNAMALPNKTEPFPKLAKAVKLPPKKIAGEGGERSNGRRRRRSPR
ncbi:MAG: ASKHA domain-containing protein, partial [Hyphomicrobiales bacterium]